MRRVPRIRLYLRHPPFCVHCFARCIAPEVGFSVCLHRSGAFFGAFLLYSGADLCCSIRSGGGFCSYTRMCCAEKNELLG